MSRAAALVLAAVFVPAALTAQSETIELVRNVRTGAVPGDGEPPADLAPLGTSAVFGTTSDLGWEPWISDRTEAGTALLADIAPGTQSSWAESFAAVPGGASCSAECG